MHYFFIAAVIIFFLLRALFYIAQRVDEDRKNREQQ